MDADSIIVHVKIDNIYKDIAENVETRFDTRNNELDRPLPKGKNKKLIGLMKDELGGQPIKEFIGLSAKTCSYLKDNIDEDKKAKSTKISVIKRKLKFQDYKNCVEIAQIENKIYHLEQNKIDVESLKEDQKEFIKNKKIILKTQQRFRSEKHNLFTEEINNIALSSNHRKIMQSIDSIESYVYGINKDLVCNREEINSNNVIKQYKKSLTLIILQKKT